ncbi:hypothetical protein D3C71_2099370 [compost metagenome]
MVHRGNGERHLDQPKLGQFGEKVEVANDQRGLGGDHHRMAGFQHHLENAAGQFVGALGRLVGVGIGAHGDGLGPIVPGRQFGA